MKNKLQSIKHTYLLKVGFLLVSIFIGYLDGISATIPSIHPEYTLSAETNHYVIDFVMPDYKIMSEDSLDAAEQRHYGTWRVMEDDGDSLYDVIDVNADCDYTDEVSYPQLPFFSIDLLLPKNANNVRVILKSSELEEVSFNHYVQPAILGNKSDEVCFNRHYYENNMDSVYPNGFYRDYYTISEIYYYEGRKGVTLSIFPFAYYPNVHIAKVLKTGRFVVDFDSSDLWYEMDDVLQSLDMSATLAKLVFNTFDGYSIDLDTRPSYLIVAARKGIASYLQPYVNYKTQQGYNTQVVYLDEAGLLRQGGEKLAEFINKKNGVISNPNYVLLVGDLTDIPSYTGKKC